MAVHATQLSLLGIKYRYQEGQDIMVKPIIRDGRGRRYGNPNWIYAEVVKFFNDFMLIKTKNYTMTVPYRDILIGAVQVK